MKHYDIIVVGGGPAGIFAAGFAARHGKQVLLLERNKRCGAKVLITGKGRCNVTNSDGDPRRFCERFGRQGKSLLTALYAFGVEDTIEFFEDRGLELQCERGGRVFPAQGNAADVQNLLDAFLTQSGVTLKNNCQVKNLVCSEERIQSVMTSHGELTSERFIVATGGLSYPETGCRGDGYAWARQTGHEIIPPEPALVPVHLFEDWTADLSRFNLKNVRISLLQDNKKLDERFGEAFFTRHGIGGPIVLDMSAAIRDALKKGPASLCLDLKPAVEEELFDKRLQRELTAQSNRDFSNALGGLLPKDMIPLFIRLSGISPEKKCHSVSRNERKILLNLFKNLELRVRAVSGFDKAIVTSGGVSLKDIDMRTMRSKKLDNLSFAGEMIDLDGPTGGYNLQLCWSTGYLAGVSAAS